MAGATMVGRGVVGIGLVVCFWTLYATGCRDACVGMIIGGYATGLVITLIGVGMRGEDDG